ncbi:MAG: winged helix-turn-helix domain-containing protein [Candidatus Thermoplasmatota archaeon]
MMPRVVHVKEETVVAALNSETARRIMSRCIHKAMAVKDLSEKTAIPLPSAYRHVNGLVEDGLLYVERSAMTADGKPYDLYRSTLKSCRIEMDADGVRVTWELNSSADQRLQHMWQSLRGERRG